MASSWASRAGFEAVAFEAVAFEAVAFEETIRRSGEGV